jgi:UDP-N-acetylglucosamine--N-acetylmuramyl-(pentapeptide) pyrophosphoryl-undecaprenol N-acetylglucosamine transferase
MTRRLALVVGDTAGHVLPAVAVARAYGEFAGTEVLFLAGAGGHASRLVPAAGYPLVIVPGSALARVGPAGKVAALGNALKGTVRARRVLADHGIRLVIGSGGYASGGVLLAARTMRLRTAIIEPNAAPGLANQILKHVVDRIYVTCDETLGAFPRGRTVLTGTPLLPELVARLHSGERERPTGARWRLLVTGGSRGDEFFASRVPELVGALRARGLSVAVQHQTGATPPEQVVERYRRAGIEADAAPYLDMPTAYAEADLVIARAGAGTLAELALAGLPALLVPLADAAGDHQARNAAAVAASGAAAWIRERDWTVARALDLIWPLLTDASAWHLASKAARRRARPGAAAALVADCEAQMQGRW